VKGRAGVTAVSEISFGAFTLNLEQRRLMHNAAVVPLKPKEADLLVFLAGRPSATLSRDEIIEELWPGTVASEGALSQTVYRLRRALADFDPTNEYVRTVPGVGFSLVNAQRTSEQSARLGFVHPVFPLYQQAMFRMRTRTVTALRESITLLERALRLEPEYVPALVGLAQAYTNAGIRLICNPRDAYWRARTALEKAIDSDPADAEAFTLLSLLLLFYNGNRELARNAAQHAVILAPASPKARNGTVWQLIAHEQFSAALAEADAALRLNPASAHLTTLLGIALYMSERYDEASMHFVDALNFMPSYAPALLYDACAQYMLGHYLEAEALLARILDADLSAREIAVRGCIAARRGDRHAVHHCLEQLAVLPVPSDFARCTMYVAMTDWAKAAHALSRAFDAREPAVFTAAIDPMYAPLRERHPALIATIRVGHRSMCDRCGTHVFRDPTLPLYRTVTCAACTRASGARVS
jgi:DNA-binding winged helix-turn-helix (wHTH) protein/Tfp pilus assembly protein PilF